MDSLPVETQMSGDPKTNEWNLLKDQFDALVHDESVAPTASKRSLILNFVAVSPN